MDKLGDLGDLGDSGKRECAHVRDCEEVTKNAFT